MDSGLEKRIIDGREYEFEKFGASQAMRILLKIGKIIGGPLGMAVGAMKSGLDSELDPDLLGKAVGELFLKADEAEVIQLMKELAADKLLCDGKKINFDMHYSGNLGHLLQVVKTALEVQYGNFFAELLAVLPVKRKAKQ